MITIQPLKDVVGDPFSAELSFSISFLDPDNTLVPGLCIVVSEHRELRRDAILSLLQEKFGDIYKQRMVVISDNPEEIPARPPTEDASLEEYTYAPALFSVAPGEANLRDEGMLSTLRVPEESTTKLARTISDFSRWDIDTFVVLSPLEMFSWTALASMVLTGSVTIAGIERTPGEVVSIGQESIGALELLDANDPKGSVTILDLDQQKIFKTLADAKIVA